MSNTNTTKTQSDVRNVMGHLLSSAECMALATMAGNEGEYIAPQGAEMSSYMRRLERQGLLVIEERWLQYGRAGGRIAPVATMTDRGYAVARFSRTAQACA